MKKLLFVGLCVLLFILSFASVIAFRVMQVKSEVAPIEASFTPVPIDYKLVPPKQSLTGKVTRITGNVEKSVRNENNPQQVTEQSLFLEGEQLIASPGASLDIQFSTNDLFSISPNTILAFPSTNPKNFLFKIDKGAVVFQTDEKISTISARSMHALFSLSQGKAELSVDPDKKIITYMIAEGQGEVGYIDTDNKTQMVTVSTDQILTFDDEKRIIKIK